MIGAGLGPLASRVKEERFVEPQAAGGTPQAASHKPLGEPWS